MPSQLHLKKIVFRFAWYIWNIVHNYNTLSSDTFDKSQQYNPSWLCDQYQWFIYAYWLV